MEGSEDRSGSEDEDADENEKGKDRDAGDDSPEEEIEELRKKVRDMEEELKNARRKIRTLQGGSEIEKEDFMSEEEAMFQCAM